jgi:hypothetical protein
VRAAERPLGAAPVGDDRGAAGDVTPGEPEAEVELALGVRVGCEPAGVSPLGVCTTGFGIGAALIDGVPMAGVLTDGTLTVRTVTDGVVTDGTVTAGALIVGVGTLTVGTLIVGTDASEDAATASSTPQTARPATTRERTGARTGRGSPPDRSATEGLDIAHRLRTRPLRSAREPLVRVHHPRSPAAAVPENGETRT